jgi:hypothetical protein
MATGPKPKKVKGYNDLTVIATTGEATHQELDQRLKDEAPELLSEVEPKIEDLQREDGKAAREPPPLTEWENVLERIRTLIDERMELAKRLADVDRLLKEAMEHGRRF